MTNLITRQIRKSVKEIKDKIYDTLRAGVRIAYTAVPIVTYAATEAKLNKIDNMFFLWRWLAKLPIFYGADIEKLSRLNDYSVKGVGVAGGLLIGDRINRGFEKLLPRNSKTRKLGEIVGYFGAANIANVFLSGTEKIKDISFLEALASNAQNTLIRAKDTAYNLMNQYNGTDIESMASAGVMALVGLTGVKLASYLLGENYNGYEERRIGRDILRRARKKEDKRQVRIRAEL